MNLLTPYLAAGYPAVAVETHEEDRFLAGLVRDHSGEAGKVYLMTAGPGLREGSIDRHGNVAWAVADAALASHSAALAKLAKMAGEGVILVLADWHHIARNAPAYRALKDVLPSCKAKGFCVILLAPSWSLPVELQHDVPVVQFVLPTRTELGEALDLISDSVQDGAPRLEGDARDAVLDAAAGLTLQEAESAFALSFAVTSRIDPRRVEQEKMSLVRQSGYLEVTPPVPVDAVGGLGALREYLETEVVPSWHDDLLRCRGVLLVGVAGGGKSLSAKMAGSLLQCPVLRMDIAALKASHVGESEARMRSALALADAVAPCVLYLDEVEKGVGGFASSAQSDSGVTLGMIGSLLTWMADHSTQVVVIATCNDYAKLPPELTRAGRFDERFFCDLPTRSERVEISRIHLSRFMPSETPETDGQQAGLAERLADLTDAWTGAEIEQAVKSAARKSRRNISEEALRSSVAEIKPISVVRPKETADLREWGRANLRPANTPETVEAAPTARRRVTNV
jgi:SpoVK/Ycf46/Vps4 family AAA+-type ATPase